MTWNTNTAIGIAGVVAAAILAVWLGVSILTTLIVLLVVLAVIYFVTPVRTVVFGWLGWTEPSPSELFATAVADVEAIATKFENAAKGLYDEVTGHQADAAEATKLADDKQKLADRATAAAANHKALIGA